MSFVVVDASIWVSRLIPQDEHHERCQKWLIAQRAAGVTLVSPSLLLPEVAGAISRRTGDAALADRAVQSLQALPGLRLVEMNQSVVQVAAQMAASCGMRGADSVYAAVAHQLSIPLATLDADQRTKAGQMVAIQKDFC
ncbi:MAG: type II toxin-antitoxin system VapC family toxin [Chloroflexi bacterium]|nr:type II toxin-antitoxin system VapC family toxin [Chloroflexota bacterium]